MTAKRRHGVKCEKCRFGVRFCPNCGSEIYAETPFQKWVRDQPELESIKQGIDGENIDFAWFKYLDAWLILIEEKRYGVSSSKAQKDTHSIVNQMLAHASGQEFETMRGKRRIEYRGYFLIQFEKTCPDDSRWIRINGEVHCAGDLFVLLRYGKLVSFELCDNENIIELARRVGKALGLKEGIDLQIANKY